MPYDYSEAFESSAAVAEKGDRTAQFNLGLMYGLGLGVAQNYALAVEWYRKAAEQGEARAQANLGWMYGTGRGVPQDYIRAYAWYNLAAAQGEGNARKNRDSVAAEMSAAQLAQGQEMAGELFERITVAKVDSRHQTADDGNGS